MSVAAAVLSPFLRAGAVTTKSDAISFTSAVGRSMNIASFVAVGFGHRVAISNRDDGSVIATMDSLSATSLRNFVLWSFWISNAASRGNLDIFLILSQIA